MSVWFEGESELPCAMDQVRESFEDLGQHYLSVVRLMPGLVDVELLDQTPNSVTIKTNEGLMKRRNITRRSGPDKLTVEFDEEYEAGSKMTAQTHFVDEFTASGNSVSHRLVMSDVQASGVLGFFYSRFGSKKMGKAFLEAYQTYFAAS